jgi:RNase adaptor protein for sRNA GlmZ degradation
MSSVKIITFGFKYGLPNCNYWFDVSFLKNPVRQPGRTLRDKIDDDMIDFVRSQQETPGIVEIIKNLILFVSHLDGDIRVGIGCNSGRHRSRAIAKLVEEKIENKIQLIILHREELIDSY